MCMPGIEATQEVSAGVADAFEMVKGPPFFSSFGGGWSFKELGPDRTAATWRYTFSIRPSWLSAVGDPIGTRILGRDIELRLAAFAAGCEDSELLARARAQLGA